MTPEQLDALKAALAPLVQFQYGPIVTGLPYQGFVTLTAHQYRALEELANS